MRLFARFWPFGRPQSNPPAVGPQFHPLESNRNPSKMYSMFGAPFSQFSVFQLFPFSPLYLMFCGAYVYPAFLCLSHFRSGRRPCYASRPEKHLAPLYSHPFCSEKHPVPLFSHLSCPPKASISGFNCPLRSEMCPIPRLSPLLRPLQSYL